MRRGHERAARPATVAAATWLLYGLAVSYLAHAAMELAELGRIREAVDAATADRAVADTVVSAFTAGHVLSIGISLLWAIGSSVLGRLIGRGRRAARIATWALCAVVFCTGVISLLPSRGPDDPPPGAFSSGTIDPATGTVKWDPLPQSTEQIAQRAVDALPDWYTLLAVALTVVMVAATLAVGVLLMLPASHEYFAEDGRTPRQAPARFGASRPAAQGTGTPMPTVPPPHEDPRARSSKGRTIDTPPGDQL